MTDKEKVLKSPHDKNAIRIMTEFVEGKMSIADFKKEFDNNDIIKMILRQDPLFAEKRADSINYFVGNKQENLIIYLQSCNWAARGGQLNIWGEISWFLSRYGYTHKPTKYYDEQYSFLLNIQPSWLDVTDEDFLTANVIDKMPLELKTKKQKIQWCKDRLRELFKFDTRPPRWIQNPDWPIVNGKPLVFKRQSKDIPNDERVFYYFYDPDTLAETVVEQLW